MDKDELKKWRWLALAVSLVGIVFISLPVIPNQTKFFLAIPLYVIFVYVYYQYLCIKKRMASKEQLVKKKVSESDSSGKRDDSPGRKKNKRNR